MSTKLIFNTSATHNSVTKVTRDDGEYLVAPVTLIVPGVLSGNEGPLYYPTWEVVNSVKKWNGIELTLDHPKEDQPESRIVIGHIENSRIKNGKLVADAYIHVEKANKADKRITEVLTRNETVEVSTGLLLTAIPDVGEYKGRPYEAVATNYNPDHLAILPDKIGACSRDDGCGLNVVNCSCTERQVMNLVDQIITNSNGLFTDADKERLQGMSEDQLKGLRQMQIDNAKKPEPPKKKEGEEGEGKKKPVTNSDDGKNEPVKVPVINMQEEIGKYMSNLTPEQYYELAPTEVKEVLASAKRTHNERKNELIDQLTQGITDDNTKATMVSNLQTKDIAELELYASAWDKPKISADNPFASGMSYVGNSNGAPMRMTVDNLKKDRTEDLLMPVSEIDWSEN